jgi:hypothetical protein
MSTRTGKLSVLIVVLVGCASSEPPLDELSLRDAMSAQPSVIAAMPYEARRALAVRLHADELADTNVRIVPREIALPSLEGRNPSSPTDAIETRALAGTAGQVLSATVAETKATHLVRVTQSPAAIAVDGDTVYVNASYLVAMAAYDQPPDTGTGTGTGSGTGSDSQPTLQPTPYTFCSVAGEDASRERRLFWIIGPLAFVLIRGRVWKRRSKRG